MRKLAAGIAFAAALSAIPALALAAQPNHQACLGHDVSGYAQGGAAFSGFISGLASGTGGVGDEIQAHLAGQVPDMVNPNSCNDPG